MFASLTSVHEDPSQVSVFVGLPGLGPATFPNARTVNVDVPPTAALLLAVFKSLSSDQEVPLYSSVNATDVG